MIEVKQEADIFDQDVQALVNPINCKGAMGKGLALEFKQRFPEYYRDYALRCQQRAIQVGKMALFDRGPFEVRHRYLIGFPTKNDWRFPSCQSFIAQGLVDLRQVILAKSIASIAIPALGCGEGNLNWAQVEPLIRSSLEGLDCLIVLIPPR